MSTRLNEKIEKFNEVDECEGRLVKLFASYSSPKSNKVLIVDDEPSVHFVLSSILEENEYNPFSVENGKKAFEFLEKNPQLYAIILDNNMPVMTGEEFICSLRKREYKEFKESRKKFIDEFHNVSFEPHYVIAIGQGFSEKASGMFNAKISKPINMNELLYSLNKRFQYKSSKSC